MQFEWKKEYNVNIRTIDLGHQKVFELFEDLLNKYNLGSDNSYIENILNRISAQVYDVFKVEEKLFYQYGYPQSHQHKIIHEEFKIRIVMLKLMASKNYLILNNKIFNQLKDWWLNHLLGEDKRFADFAAKRELEVTPN